jgi:predicted small secreted protein
MQPLSVIIKTVKQNNKTEHKMKKVIGLVLTMVICISAYNTVAGAGYDKCVAEQRGNCELLK